MDLDLRLVRAFVVVAEEEHVGRAARRLHVSQPALSKQLKRLESQLGVALLERVGRNVRLTAAGRAFAAEGAALLQRGERAAGAAAKAARVERGTVRIAFVPPLPIQVSSLLNESQWPVELRRVDWVSQATVLRDGVADLCILRLPVDGPDLEWVVLLSEPRVAGFHADHRLASVGNVSLADLTHEPIVDVASHRDYWGVNPRPDGTAPVWGPVVLNVEEMLEVVASGKAMCITGASVGDFYRRPDVSFVPIRDLSPSEIAVAWLSGGLTEPSRSVLDLFAE